MIRVLIASMRTKKEHGDVALRFRLTDSNRADLYYRSDIIAPVEQLKRLTPTGEKKPRTSGHDEALIKSIREVVELLATAYTNIQSKGAPITSESLTDEMSHLLDPAARESENRGFLAMFHEYLDSQLRDEIIGEGRYKHGIVMYKEILRFLTINRMTDVSIDEVSDKTLMALRNFFFDEYKYVPRYPYLYEGMNSRNIPRARRSPNTVTNSIKKLRAFFGELEDRDVIYKSPFKRIAREVRKSIVSQAHDIPVFLHRDELRTIIDAEVPEGLKEVRTMFILQCAFGCRISDFVRLSMDNVSVSSEGIPYLHYLPEKTKKVNSHKAEIVTPIVKYAFNIINERGFGSPLFTYVYGKSGYNQKIRLLLKHCGIDRLCTVFDHHKGTNKYIPIWEIAGSKLCRKTHVDMMNKVQIDKYAAGLHSRGSDAVNHYTAMELSDRFVLMNLAFGEPDFRVNNNLEVISL